MQRRLLGRTELSLTEVTLGTWGLTEEVYGPVEPELIDEVVREAVAQGVASFDLAPLWGDGEAERRVGALLAELEVEDPVVITRAGVFREDDVLRGDFDSEALVEACEDSLRRLGRERIELWLLHNPGDEILAQDGWREAVDRLERDGKIAAWGVSVGDAEEARLALTAGAQALCLTHHLFARDLDDLRVEIEEAGCGVLARSPLLHGMLAGQWSEMKQFPDDDHRGRRWGLDAFAVRIRQVQDLGFLVGHEHADLATAALRFVLGDERVSSAVVGARSARQVRHAVLAANGPPWISDDDLARVAKVIR